MRYLVLLLIPLLFVGCSLPWQKDKPTAVNPFQPIEKPKPIENPGKKTDVQQTPTDNSVAYQKMQEQVRANAGVFLKERQLAGRTEATAQVELVVWTGLLYDYISQCNQLGIDRTRLPAAYQMFNAAYKYRGDFSHIMVPAVDYVASIPNMDNVGAYYILKAMTAEVSKIGARGAEISLEGLAEDVTKDAPQKCELSERPDPKAVPPVDPKVEMKVEHAKP